MVVRTRKSVPPCPSLAECLAVACCRIEAATAAAGRGAEGASGHGLAKGGQEALKEVSKEHLGRVLEVVCALPLETL